MLNNILTFILPVGCFFPLNRITTKDRSGCVFLFTSIERKAWQSWNCVEHATFVFNYRSAERESSVFYSKK